jgi:protein TonB
LAPDKSLPGLVAPSVSIPAFSTPVSQGVVDGALQRKVTPVYPTSAFPYRLSGSVVMTATVDQTGRVQNLKVVSGHPILAQAAMSAVREWKYAPSTLNGKPIAVQKEITVSFKAPQ